MIKYSIFIAALFLTNSAYQIWMVSGENCTAALNRPPYSNACIFDCIENFYDFQYCKICSNESHAIKLNRTETLASLIQYDFVHYDKQNESILNFSSCSDCDTNQTDENLLKEYTLPEDLMEFYILTYYLTIESHKKLNHTIVQSVHELYKNITNRFDETKKWCVNALGITEEYEKFKINIAAVDSESQNIKILDRTSEHPPLNVSLNPVDNELKSTTQIPEQTTVILQNVTSKLQNMPSLPDSSDTDKPVTIMAKNKPQLHDHHFHHSVTIITAVGLILLAILIVSVAIIGLFINRHKNMGAHLTNSRTYVFDQQN